MPANKEGGKNLYKKLLAITEEIGKIAKTGKNMQQGYNFIEQALIVAEVRVQLAKHGVMIIPETVSRRVDRYDVVRSSGKAGVDVHVNVVSRYTIINADDPAERFTAEWDAGEAIDSGDKATNKAVTASDKYFLMKLFKISDKDDPDSESPALEPASVAPAQAYNTQNKEITIKDPDSPITDGQVKMLGIQIKLKKLSNEDRDAVKQLVLSDTPEELTKGQAHQLIDYLTKHSETEIRTDISNVT